MNRNTTSITSYNGDIIDGVPVITKLNVDDLAPGKVHRFMFKGADMNIGQSWYVPVIIVKGQYPGKKLLLNTGIHGDELNGSRTIHKLFEDLDPAQLSGTIVGVVQACPNSLLHINRGWYISSDGGGYDDMNRAFPGDLSGPTSRVQAYKLWNDLWGGNADYVIDLHSQSTDTMYPLFIYADYRVQAAKRMAELVPADQIKIDEGESGTVETTFIQHNIPAITLEIGQGRCYEPEYINRAVEGIKNILIDLGIINGSLGKTAQGYGTFIGNSMQTIRARIGGYAEIMVAIGDMVEVGQLLAVQRNPFGDVTIRYQAQVAGKVVSVGSGATREAGGLLVRILYSS